MARLELLLPLGALAFYVYDSLLLLYGNELIVVRRGRQWEVSRGAGLVWLGRRVYLPNLLTPHRSLYRMCWRLDGASGAVDAMPAIQALERALSPLRAPVLALLLLLVAALPAVSWTLGEGWPLLTVFATYYLLVIVMLVVAAGRRGQLGLRGRDCWSLAFEALACAPFAVNLLRRISLRYALSGNPLSFAQAHFDAAGRAAMIGLVRAQLQDELAREEPHSAAYQRLEDAIEQLQVHGS